MFLRLPEGVTSYPCRSSGDRLGRSVARRGSMALPQGECVATCTSAASVWACSHVTVVANALELCRHMVQQGFWIRMSLVLSASQRHICNSVGDSSGCAPSVMLTGSRRFISAPPSAVPRAPRQSRIASDAPGKPCRLSRPAAGLRAPL